MVMKRRNFIKGIGLVGAAAYVDPLSLINSNSLLYPNQLWKPTVKALYTPVFDKFQLDMGKLKGLVKQGVMDIQEDNLIFCWPFHSDWMVNDPERLKKWGDIAKGQGYIKLEQTHLENLGLKEIGSLTDNTLHNINPSKMLNWAVDQNFNIDDYLRPYYACENPIVVKDLKFRDNDDNVFRASNQPVYSIPIKNFGQFVDYCSYQYHIAYEYNLVMSRIEYNPNTGELDFWGNENKYYPTKVMKVEEGNMIYIRKGDWEEDTKEWRKPIEYKGSHRAHGCPEKKTGCYSEEKYGPGGKVDKYGICHRAHGGDYEYDTIEESLGEMKLVATPLSKDDNWQFGKLPKVFTLSHLCAWW